MYEIHQDFFMNVSFSRNRAFHPEGDSRIYSRIRQIRRFEGVRFLPKFPNTSPSGKRVDSDDPIPRKTSRILVKHVTLGTSEWTHVPQKIRNGHI
jgi:hypothetical protein